ncbi:MAG: M14 metallopeptidase family protein, partial [Ferruginibacter sp.]
MKNLFFTLLFFAFTINASAQLQSPDAFLGYRLGSRFTPHYKVVAYCEHVAQNSKMVQLQQYGETYEHRPLLAAFVGTEANIGQLEKIRDNNLQLARQSVTAGAGSTNTPAIIWLSYNVHGNEPTSTEAAMATLYALAEPSNSATKAWLQNTIVVIDPCENPDGRDRYVNWYNSVAGKNYNVQPICREHIEPWPRGRSNHYNFDLNRDWAWQTQVESLQRMALYNKWLPQVHVDFHEQGYNAPYYFAPAAEPFHDIITKWQREFQFFIGKNNAKYFDQNNWLYFTRERFDLFYPSYGDTYPMYNGSIGMTYEQGGISGGLGVITSENDTLTFVQRVQHHVIAS